MPASPFSGGGNPSWVNRHESHLVFPNSYYPADYNYASGYTTKINCVICHNVHGSTRLAMVRDGKLIQGVVVSSPENVKRFLADSGRGCEND